MQEGRKLVRTTVRMITVCYLLCLITVAGHTCWHNIAFIATASSTQLTSVKWWSWIQCFKWHCCWLFFSLRINHWLAVMSPGWFGIVEWRLFQAQSENLLRIFQAFTLLSWAISLLIYIRPCTLCCASCGRGTKQNCVSWRDLNVRKYSKIMEASSKRKKIWSLMILLHLNTYYVCLNWRWL